MDTQQIDHIGIAVHSIDESIVLYRDILGLEFLGKEEIQDQLIEIANFKTGDCIIELMQPLNNKSPISSFLEKKGEGIHHIAYRVKELDNTLFELKAKGIKLIDNKPRIGSHGKKIAFIHPSSTNKTLIELCELPKK